MWKLDINTGYNLDIRLHSFMFPLQVSVLTRINFVISQHMLILEKKNCTVTATA